MSKEKYKLPELPNADFITCGCTGDSAGYSKRLMIEYASKTVEVELKETQAAANKAAEEGEPTDAELAHAVLLEDLEAIANYWDDMVVETAQHGDIDVGRNLRERFAALKFPAIAADRASRQVANKAEVEQTCVCGSPATLGSVHRTDGPCYVAEATIPANKAEVETDVLDAHRYRWLRSNNIVANVRFHFASGESPYLYDEALDEAIDHNMGYTPVATPPATTGGAKATPTRASTACYGASKPEQPCPCVDCKAEVGASTVLTDERKPLGYARFRAAQRITTDGDVDANEWYEFCEAHEVGDDKLPAFPVYVEPVGEVAAQAGQVAVPGLSEEQMHRIARNYFSEQWAIQHAKDAMTDALTEAGTAFQAAVPEGFVLVPIKPTPKMVDATFNHIHLGSESHNARNKRIYAAMIAAAPSPAKESK